MRARIHTHTFTHTHTLTYIDTHTHPYGQEYSRTNIRTQRPNRISNINNVIHVCYRIDNINNVIHVCYRIDNINNAFFTVEYVFGHRNGVGYTYICIDLEGDKV